MDELANRLRSMALEVGFSDMGICAPDAMPETAGRLQEFLKAGLHGDMSWMERRAKWRGSPTALWPEAKSVIMLADNYGPDEDPLKLLSMRERGNISVYARNKDYHDPIKKRLKRLGRWLVEQESCEIKVFVDTAPVMEKPLAAAAGLGWQGKHTNLLARDLGSWFFLGAIFTTVELPVDAPATNHCGECTSCLDACPTGAFPAAYQIDARRCISYLTIEHHGPVDEDLRPMLGNRIYGCDDCLSACPWNKFAVEASEMRYAARADLIAPDLAELAKLDDASFRTYFSGSPVKRIGIKRFLRNVLYAMGNSERAELQDAITPHLADEDETVRDAALWAKTRLDAL